MAQDDGVQSAGAGPATNSTAAVTGSALDDNVERPYGAQGLGPSSGSPKVLPQRHPPQWTTGPTSDPGFSSTPRQQRGAHTVLPASAGAGRSMSATSQGLIGPRIALTLISLPKLSGDRRS